MDKPILVQKYGGSSVADQEKLRHVARRVVEAVQRGYGVVVVVSAMGNTTNELMSLANSMAPEPPRRELDMLLSAGERMSMSLLSMAIQEMGQEAISFTGSQSGILTNARHFDARIIEVRPFRIQDELAQGKVVIVAGYQGMSYKREVTTLGRGGSDTTAVALAAALDAEACEIYSDVDGVYGADPRVVANAERLPEVSYDEMEQMARCGARVLHAEAVAYARKHDIALFARGTTSTGTGTIIRKDRDFQTMLVRPPAVAARNDLLRLRVELTALQRLALTRCIKRLDIPPLWMFWDEQSVELLFSRGDLPHLASAQSEIEALLDHVPEWREVAAVSLIRDAIEREPDWLASSIQALQLKEAVSLWRIDGGPSRLTFVVPPERCEDAQQRLHQMIQRMCQAGGDA